MSPSVYSLVVAASDATGTYRIVLRVTPIVVRICSICTNHTIDDSTLSRCAIYADVMKDAIRCRTVRMCVI